MKEILIKNASDPILLYDFNLENVMLQATLAR